MRAERIPHTMIAPPDGIASGIREGIASAHRGGMDGLDPSAGEVVFKSLVQVSLSRRISLPGYRWNGYFMVLSLRYVANKTHNQRTVKTIEGGQSTLMRWRKLLLVS